MALYCPHQKKEAGGIKPKVVRCREVGVDCDFEARGYAPPGRIRLDGLGSWCRGSFLSCPCDLFLGASGHPDQQGNGRENSNSLFFASSNTPSQFSHVPLLGRPTRGVDLQTK
jgi:hypothetical protein